MAKAISLPVPVIPAMTRNVFLYDLYNMYAQYRHQFGFSTQSANASSGMDSNDIDRWDKYAAALDAKVAYIENFPNLDVAEYEREFPYQPLEQLKPIENNDLVQFILLIENAMMNIVHSGQSSRNMYTMHPADMKRIKEDVEVLKEFVESYIKVATPLDLTSSTPTVESVGVGYQDT